MESTVNDLQKGYFSYTACDTISSETINWFTLYRQASATNNPYWK